MLLHQQHHQQTWQQPAIDTLFINGNTGNTSFGDLMESTLMSLLLIHDLR